MVGDSDIGPAAANFGRVGDRRYFVLSVANRAPAGERDEWQERYEG
jgi:hypothetical protein